MVVRSRFIAAAHLVLVALAAAQTPASVYFTFEEARGVLAALEVPHPTATEWPAWISAADRATRARLAKGDETSIVNWLFFGTSFTSEPRLTSRQLQGPDVVRAAAARIDDMVRALAGSATSERLEAAREVLRPAGISRARLVSLVEEALQERATYDRLVEQARQLGDPRLQFAERSRIYRDRGLSSDTSLQSSFAIEEALTQLFAGGRPRERLERVGIIGPGLDFADKQDGFDFYPLQTIQPFGIQDSLLRLGLARSESLRVTTFDVSARVNGHIGRARREAQKNTPYVVHLPLDGSIKWAPAFVRHWERFGDRVGSPVALPAPRGAGPLRLRAVRVSPAAVQRIVPIDINVTAQRLALADAERFDLVIATNVFVYYDHLQQGLAMAGIARMLRPGGLLLSNNALVEIPDAGMQSIGYSRTQYSDGPEDGDLVVWYQKAIR